MSSSRPGTCRTRSGTPQVRQVTCSIHPGRPCQACILCKQGNLSKYFHPKTWKDKTLVEHLREYEPSVDIQPDSCICRPCRDDVSKIHTANFTPRWRKLKVHEKPECYIPGCSNIASKVTKLTTKASMCDLLGVQMENPDHACNDNEETALCMEHYGAIYRLLNPTNRKCITCSKTLTDPTRSRKCPEPELIQKFLVQNTEFSGEIGTEDRVCYVCYRAHLITIKHLQNTTTSTDADLSTTIERIKRDTSTVTDIHTLEQALTYAVHFSALSVGEALMRQNALLLPDVYDSFQDKLLETINIRGIVVDQDLHSVANSSWLRTQLSLLLEHHMAYRCPVKRYGTVLYRYGGDLVHALSVSLGQARNRSQPCSVDKERNSNFQTTLSEVCHTLNSKRSGRDNG